VMALIAVADAEWQGVILFSYHTGIRLSDAASLTWANIDGRLLRFRDAKTAHRKKRRSDGENVIVMASDLLGYLKSLPLPMRNDTPLFPSLHGKKSGSGNGLSAKFSNLMCKAGIGREEGDVKQGKGRRFNALSFHSLRHTMISRLANSGASEAVRMEMAGHSTDEAHRRYVHLDTKAQEEVVAKAPRLWRPSAA
jgi:integrase